MEVDLKIDITQSREAAKKKNTKPLIYANRSLIDLNDVIFDSEALAFMSGWYFHGLCAFAPWRETCIAFQTGECQMFKQIIGISSVLTLTVAIGCNSSSSSSDSGGTSMDALANQVDAQNAARKQQDQAAAAAAKAAADQQATAAAQAAQTPPETEKKAVGSRAQMEGGGYLRAIGSARRHVMNVVDQIAWIQGVRSFKAEEGRKPKDNNEFMKVVVTRYDLQLPRLEEDEEYLYDPNGETDGDYGQLYVVKKQTAATDPAAPQPPAK